MNAKPMSPRHPLPIQTVVVNYQIGFVHDIYEQLGVTYVDVTLPGGVRVVADKQDVTPIGVFMDIARRAELEVCRVCSGTGRIDPIENPPYECNACKGEGFFVRKP